MCANVSRVSYYGSLISVNNCLDDRYASGSRIVDFAFVRAFANFEHSVVSPTGTPRVYHQPILYAVFDTPSDQFNVVSAQRRGVFGLLVNTWRQKNKKNNWYFVSTLLDVVLSTDRFCNSRNRRTREMTLLSARTFPRPSEWPRTSDDTRL